MQINNNPSTQNFGMALRIKPGAADFLKRQSDSTLETLGKLGEEFADYKFWDLEVDEKGFRVAGKQVLDSAYRNVRRPVDDNAIRYDGVNVTVTADKFADKGNDVVRTLMYESREEAMAAAQRLRAGVSDIDVTAAFVRELETLSAKKAAEEAAKIAADQAKETKVNELMSKFGTGFEGWNA